MPFPAATPPESPFLARLKVNRAEYRQLCEKRWFGEPRQDALRNWVAFQAIRDRLIVALWAFHRDRYMEDLGGQFRNPDGTLTKMLWTLQTAIEPDQSRLHPLLDFEETFQTIFLRRGLLIYCQLILQQMSDHETREEA